jgi:hypothetical protein
MNDIPEFELTRRILRVTEDMAEEISPGQGLPYSVIYGALHFVQLHFDRQLLGTMSKPEIDDDEVE